VNQNSLIATVVATMAGKPTVVVMKSGTGILMPWASSVQAILEAWYPGEEDGNAVAAVLFGDVNPSGKLPLTFLKQGSDVSPPLWDLTSSTDSNPHAAQYPGLNQTGSAVCTQPDFPPINGPDSGCTVTYTEEVFVGYRYYDENGIAPLFPFGYGLSYTNFAFAPGTLAPTPSSVSFTQNPSATISVTFDVTNAGNVAGAEVAQLYVSGCVSSCAWPGSGAVAEPLKQLKAFHKTAVLAPKGTEQVTLTLDMRSFAYWDVSSESWVVVPGNYTIMVGDSSRGISSPSGILPFVTGTVTITP